MTVKYSDWIAAAMAGGNGSKGRDELQLPQLAQPQPSFRGIEVMSSESSIPVEFTQSGLTESVLVPLVNQFGLMQQQMFDQFQQAMAMMVQMFGTMHRDQMEVIRAELDRLHELTDEIHALKDELAKRTRESAYTMRVEPEEQTQTAQAISGISSRPSSMPLHRPSSDPQVSEVAPAPVVRSQPPTIESLERGPVRFPGAFPGPTTEELNPVLTPASPASERQQALEPRLFPTSAVPRATSTGPSLSSAHPQGPDGSSALKPDASRPAAGSERDTMVWLHQRMTTLQNERESRWQKILKLLPGVS